MGIKQFPRMRQKVGNNTLTRRTISHSTKLKRTMMKRGPTAPHMTMTSQYKCIPALVTYRCIILPKTDHPSKRWKTRTAITGKTGTMLRMSMMMRSLMRLTTAIKTTLVSSMQTTRTRVTLLAVHHSLRISIWHTKI